MTFSGCGNSDWMVGVEGCDAQLGSWSPGRSDSLVAEPWVRSHDTGEPHRRSSPGGGDQWSMRSGRPSSFVGGRSREFDDSCWNADDRPSWSTIFGTQISSSASSSCSWRNPSKCMGSSWPIRFGGIVLEENSNVEVMSSISEGKIAPLLGSRCAWAIESQNAGGRRCRGPSVEIVWHGASDVVASPTRDGDRRTWWVGSKGFRRRIRRRLLWVPHNSRSSPLCSARWSLRDSVSHLWWPKHTANVVQDWIVVADRAVCGRSGRLRSRATATEKTLARVCREAGAMWRQVARDEHHRPSFRWKGNWSSCFRVASEPRRPTRSGHNDAMRADFIWRSHTQRCYRQRCNPSQSTAWQGNKVLGALARKQMSTDCCGHRNWRAVERRGVAVCGTVGTRQVQGGSPSFATVRVLGVAPSVVSYDFDFVRTSVCLFSRVLSGGEFAGDWWWDPRFRWSLRRDVSPSLLRSVFEGEVLSCDFIRVKKKKNPLKNVNNIRVEINLRKMNSTSQVSRTFFRRSWQSITWQKILSIKWEMYEEKFHVKKVFDDSSVIRWNQANKLEFGSATELLVTKRAKNQSFYPLCDWLFDKMTWRIVIDSRRWSSW